MSGSNDLSLKEIGFIFANYVTAEKGSLEEKRLAAEAAERERLKLPIYPPPDPARANPHVRALLEKYSDLPEQRTPAWFAQRKNKITASNVAKVVGDDKYHSAQRYFEERAGLRPIPPISDFARQMMDYGSLNEDRVLAQYQRDPRYGAGQKCIFSFGLCPHPSIPWLAGSPDGITEDGILLEVKCPQRRAIIPGEVPLHYISQVQVLLEIFDLETAHFIQWKEVPCGIDEFDVTVVKRDRQWFSDFALPKMQAFWDKLQIALLDQDEADPSGSSSDSSEEPPTPVLEEDD